MPGQHAGQLNHIDDKNNVKQMGQRPILGSLNGEICSNLVVRKDPGAPPVAMLMEESCSLHNQQEETDQHRNGTEASDLFSRSSRIAARLRSNLDSRISKRSDCKEALDGLEQNMKLSIKFRFRRPTIF